MSMSLKLFKILDLMKGFKWLLRLNIHACIALLLPCSGEF